MRAGADGEDGYRGRLPDSSSTSINCGPLVGAARRRASGRAELAERGRCGSLRGAARASAPP